MAEDIDREKLNQETAQIAWSELQRFFATGQAISVDPALDLIDAAYAVSRKFLQNGERNHFPYFYRPKDYLQAWPTIQDHLKFRA